MATQDDSSKNRKQQLLEAAASLFAEKGYYKTTTADIAKVIGVTQPYIFHFFKSKEELYLAVLDHAFQQIYHAFSSVEAPATQLVETMGRAFVELLANHRNEILLVMTSFTVPEPAIRDYAKEKFDAIFERVKNRFEEAEIPDASHQASIFIGQGLTITLSESLNLPKLVPWCTDETEHSE